RVVIDGSGFCWDGILPAWPSQQGCCIFVDSLIAALPPDPKNSPSAHAAHGHRSHTPHASDAHGSRKSAPPASAAHEDSERRDHTPSYRRDSEYLRAMPVIEAWRPRLV